MSESSLGTIERKRHLHHIGSRPHTACTTDHRWCCPWPPGWSVPARFLHCNGCHSLSRVSSLGGGRYAAHTETVGLCSISLKEAQSRKSLGLLLHRRFALVSGFMRCYQHFLLGLCTVSKFKHPIGISRNLQIFYFNYYNALPRHLVGGQEKKANDYFHFFLLLKHFNERLETTKNRIFLVLLLRAGY